MRVWSRQLIDARVTSDAGEQRIGRSARTALSRVELLPRERLLDSPPTVRWRKGQFHLERSLSADDGLALTDGLTFEVGGTTLRWVERRQAFEADVDRERHLLSRGDAAAWEVFADELLQCGDPLGVALRPEVGGFDVAFSLEVQPLLSARRVVALDAPRGLFRELTFTLPFGREVEEGWFAAALGHPRAWFVVAVVLEQEGPRRRRSRAPLDEAEAFVHRYAGPHLATVSRG